MERIWAPWRMEYVTSGETKGCIFCDKPKENRDVENMILKHGKLGFIMLNAFPYNNGHLLITPYRHIGDLSELNNEEMLDLMRLVKLGKDTLTHAFGPDGFNVGMNLGKVAGAGIVDHVHIHIVPRWNGDTNFMPVIADTKVMPQALANAYKALKAGMHCCESSYDNNE